VSTKLKFVTDPSDGNPALVVGDWALDKIVRVARYIDCARAARRKFSTFSSCSFIDAFSGPGRLFLRAARSFADGSPLAAWNISKREKVPFELLAIADLDQDVVSICESRLKALGAPVKAFAGPADTTIPRISKVLDRKGLHLAFLDPFNLGALTFDLVEKLAGMRHVDLLIHFSTYDSKLNLIDYIRRADPRLERIAPGWQTSVDVNQSPKSIRYSFLKHWISNVQSLGFKCGDELPEIRNTKGQDLYRLVFFSRSDFALHCWKEASGISRQINLRFE
jgi:three-Cys-motif partner protein